MKYKLSSIRSPWRRRLVSLFISLLVLLGKLQSRRARIHWVGNAGRPARPERLFFFILFFVPLGGLEPRLYLRWCLFWGLFFALFTLVETVRIIAPRRHPIPSNRTPHG